MLHKAQFDNELLLGESAKELERRLGKLFHAVDGPPRAFFELGHGEKTEDHFRIIYVTLAYGYVGSLPPETMERQLCERMFDDIEALVENEDDTTGMLLFWRKRPQVHVGAGQEPGQLHVAVRMRLAIPNLDLSKLRVFKIEGDPIFYEKVG